MKYTGDYTRNISFPIGGIGTGSFGVSGNGSFTDWEINNHPDKGNVNGYTHIAIKAVLGDKIVTKILNGDYVGRLHGEYWKGGLFGGFGHGVDKKTMAGFSHFRECEFIGEFPIAKIVFKDDDFPGIVTLTAFNPFIPHDAKNSSIPAGFFNIQIENNTNDDVLYSVAFTSHAPYSNGENKAEKSGNITIIHQKNLETNIRDEKFGDVSVATDGDDTIYQTYWFRGEWMDSVTTFWNEFNCVDDLKDRIYNEADGICCSTLVSKVKVSKKSSGETKFVYAWNYPYVTNYWIGGLDEEKNIWKNYYATIFENSKDTAKYCIENFDSLYKRTLDFKERLFASTLPEKVVDAVSSTMSVLKSPTVFRLSDGSFYGFEGCHELEGSCEGTCQHVWNYAYALAFLFPELERSIRDLEVKYCLQEDGKTEFRLSLPLGEHYRNYRACLDGQMGTIIKAYREWKISGKNDWLKDNYNSFKKMMEYAWSEKNPDRWDRDMDGVLEGRQHHTLDMELFGPSSWLEGMYLTALKAMAKMADFVGDSEFSSTCLELFDKGYNFTKENLFNGEYFIQKIDLSDKSLIDSYEDAEKYWNDETKELKYQIGEGSEIDQVLGQWHSWLVGLGEIFDEKQLKVALSYMMKYNYQPSMRAIDNPWRLFSINDEAGTVMCAYPPSSYQPKIPVPYVFETMHGFEYAFAGTLIMADMIDDGLKVVSAVRDKYDGAKRNPWNEMECGSNYARSMASYALLLAFSGFEYDIPNGYIGFKPKASGDFNFFFSVGEAFGSIEHKNGKVILDISEGSLELTKLGINFMNSVTEVKIDGTAVPFEFTDGKLLFKKTKIAKSIEIR